MAPIASAWGFWGECGAIRTVSSLLAAAIFAATTAHAQTPPQLVGPAMVQAIPAPVQMPPAAPAAVATGPAMVLQPAPAAALQPASAPAGLVLPAPAAIPVVGPPSAVASMAALTDWRPLDPENTLVIDTTKGRIIVELRPEFAPLAVARIKRLARTRVYDGLLFHRVIDGFMAQSGNPDNRDGGRSLEPDLPSEFTFRLGAEIPRTIAARPQGETDGFIGVSPYVAVDELRMAMSPDRRVSAWGAHCAGVVAMGHEAGSETGNSEFFIMRETTRSLDRRYSVVGRVVLGLDAVRAFGVGDPPLNPDRMMRARVMADLPAPDRPTVLVLNTLSPQFTALVQQIRAIKGADFSVCDVEVPVRVTPSVITAEAVRAPVRRKSRR